VPESLQRKTPMNEKWKIDGIGRVRINPEWIKAKGKGETPMSKKKKNNSVKKILGTVVPTKALKTFSFTQREVELLELGLWAKASEIQEEFQLGELDGPTADAQVKEIETLRLRFGLKK
jgi:hypothetical protein